MDEKPLKSVYFHFRFKFLAITALFFLVWVILSSSAEFDDFVSSLQFELLGPFFIMSGIFYLIFKKIPLYCPHCHKFIPTKKNWGCPNCNMMQGKETYLIDKCVHCRELAATSVCDHCKQEFKL